MDPSLGSEDGSESGPHGSLGSEDGTESGPHGSLGAEDGIPVVDTVNYEAALARAIRKDGENAAEFAARLEELVERAMPDSTDVHRARVVREKFIKGQPPHIRHPLSLQHPATLAEAVMCVLNFDKLSGYSPPMVGETSECQPKAETLGRWKRQQPGIPARSAKPPSSRQSSN